MNHYFTSERNVQIVISLMKAHGIRKVVASPGATNITFVASIQQDPFFEIYSSVDERSAAYIACGLAAESGEPVALSCTGATASRNYMPGLTEAYYRHLPILAITSTQHIGRIGSFFPQIIDRTTEPNDIAKLSIQLPTIHDEMDEWTSVTAVNKAMLELRRRGGGPVHINLTTTYSKDFSVKELPPVRVIRRICYSDSMPELPSGRIAVYAGSHRRWSRELTQAVDQFCAIHDAVVFCDHTSNYHGKYKVLYALACCQPEGALRNTRPNLLLHIGEVSGDDPSRKLGRIAAVWRIHPDGEVRDTFQHMNFVFEMDELEFFRRYTDNSKDSSHHDEYLKECRAHLDSLRSQIPELPFSNLWAASRIAPLIPENAVLHLGILNSLRSWNLFPLSESISVFSNTGGFGIDGAMSSLLGASLVDSNRLYFGILGDLAFFYDMNSLGNRHLGRNLRILLVNNGKGTEFRNFCHPAAIFGQKAESYIAAAGHYGKQSPVLVRHYAEDLGFEYMSASGKKEFESVYKRFVCPEITDKPMLFEIFTESQDESDALYAITHIEKSLEGSAAETVKKLLGQKGVQLAKKFIR